MYSKRQNSVQTSTFGSEFMAMRQAVELIQALRFKLRMFGIPLDGPASMYCDNEAVYKNIGHPDSVLKKKHHSVAYHMCREAVTSGMVRVAKEGTGTNIADLFTKHLSAFIYVLMLIWSVVLIGGAGFHSRFFIFTHVVLSRRNWFSAGEFFIFFMVFL